MGWGFDAHPTFANAIPWLPVILPVLVSVVVPKVEDYIGEKWTELNISTSFATVIGGIIKTVMCVLRALSDS